MKTCGISQPFIRRVDHEPKVDLHHLKPKETLKTQAEWNYFDGDSRAKKKKKNPVECQVEIKVNS